MAFYIERPPYYLTSQGRPAGFLNEKAIAIFKNAGVKAIFKAMPPNRIIRMIKEETGCTCSIGWFKTPERMAYAKFSLPIYQNKPLVLLVCKTNRDRFVRHKGLYDVFGDRSLIMGKVSAFSYGRHIDQLIADISPNIENVVGEQVQLIKMLAAGRIHYMLIAPEEIDSLVKSAGLDRDRFAVIQVGNMPQGNKRYLMFNKFIDDGLIDRVNRAIERLDS